MSVKELYEAGKLSEAIEALTGDVKAHPSDARLRTFLFELLCFAGDLDRADRQLDVIGHQDAQAEAAVQVYRNILHAERSRRATYAEGEKPSFLSDPPDYVKLHLEALTLLHNGADADAKARLDESAASRPTVHGRIDGQAIDDFRDCDDLLAPILELIVMRDYVWLPLEQVRELDIPAPERPRDLLWAPVRILLTDGRQQRGYVPVLYCGSHEHPDDQVKLGRMTDWKASETGPALGVGHRYFLAGDEGRALLEIRRLEIDR